MRGFQENIAGRIGHTRVVAAHDAAKRDGTRSGTARAVGHHQEVIAQRHRTTIKQFG